MLEKINIFVEFMKEVYKYFTPLGFYLLLEWCYKNPKQPTKEEVIKTILSSNMLDCYKQEAIDIVNECKDNSKNSIFLSIVKTKNMAGSDKVKIMKKF